MWLHSPFFLIFFLSGLVILIAGLLLRYSPPKKINYLYGYRTKSARQSQEHWDYAQKNSGRLMIILGGLMIGVSFMGLLLDLPDPIFAVGMLLTVILAVCYIIYYNTEKSLEENFGKS